MNSIAGIYNVLYQDNVAVFNIDGQIEIVPDLTGSGYAAVVGGQFGKSNLNGDIDLFDQVGSEKEAAVEHANQYGAAARVIAVDLLSYGSYTLLYLVVWNG